MNYKRLGIAIATPLGVVGWYFLWAFLFSVVWEPLEQTNAWGSAAIVGFVFTACAAAFIGMFVMIYKDSLSDWLHSCGCSRWDNKVCKKHRKPPVTAQQDYIRKLEKELGIGE